MADGKIFIGQDAVDVGLVDGFSTVAEQILPRTNKIQTFNIKAKMNEEELKAQHPELYNTVYGKGKNTGKTEGLSEGQEKENARVKSINDLAAGMPGYEDIISAAIADGKSEATDVSLKIVAAMKVEKSAAKTALKSDQKIIANQASATVESQVPAQKEHVKTKAAIGMEIKPSAKDGKLTEEEIKAAWEASDKYFHGGFSAFAALHKNKWRIIPKTDRPRV